MLRAEALAALAHASSFDELWSWLRQRAQGLNYHSAAAAQGATTSRAHCDDGSAWNAADGTAAATLPQEAGAECPQAPQLQHQQPPLPPVEQLGWGPDLALAFVGRLQELGAVLHAPARRTLLREATSQWLAAGVPEQQPAAAGAEAAEAGGPAATGEGAAAGAGAGAAERRHAACLATGGDVLCVTPSPEAAQRLLAAVRSLGDPEQPGSQLVLALAAPHFGRLHRAITNVDGSSGGPSKSVEVGAGGGGGPGASSAGLPPARWPPSSAAAAALVSLGAEMVRAGFPVSFTQAAVAAKSAAVTPGSVEAPVFQAVWEVVGRCVTMPGPDPSLPPLPALVAARAALRVELGLARAAEVLRRGGDAVKGVPGAAAAGAAADGAVRDEPGAARVLQQLLMNTRDTARTGRALSADQLLECAQRVEAAEAAAEVAGGVGEAAVITRAGSRRPAETAAANIRGGTRVSADKKPCGPLSCMTGCSRCYRVDGLRSMPEGASTCKPSPDECCRCHCWGYAAGLRHAAGASPRRGSGYLDGAARAAAGAGARVSVTGEAGACVRPCCCRAEVGGLDAASCAKPRSLTAGTCMHALKPRQWG